MREKKLFDGKFLSRQLDRTKTISLVWSSQCLLWQALMTIQIIVFNLMDYTISTLHKYQNDQDNYKHKYGLPKNAVKMLEPIFAELTGCALFKSVKWQ